MNERFQSKPISEIPGISPEFRNYLSMHPESLAEFLAITNAEKRFDVMESFATLTVVKDEKERFEMIMDFINPAKKTRSAKA
jgi:hypothetical protein